MSWADFEDRFFGLIVLLVFGLIIARGVYILHEARTFSCPKGQTVVIDFLAVPFVQDGVSCSSGA